VEYERVLHDLATQSSLQGHVHFLGVRNDVSEILNELTILLHTARQEPLGRVLLEAAASQVPVIATNVGGTGEIFAPLVHQQQPAAILIDNPEAKSDVDLAGEIANQTMLLLKNPALRNELAQQALEVVSKCFAVEKSAEAIYSHYQACFPERFA
jgi:glycosyltransferase involved in cell wall biosynthesis